jgi:hypothetical protein
MRALSDPNIETASLRLTLLPSGDETRALVDLNKISHEVWGRFKATASLAPSVLLPYDFIRDGEPDMTIAGFRRNVLAKL